MVKTKNAPKQTAQYEGGSAPLAPMPDDEPAGTSLEAYVLPITHSDAMLRKKGITPRVIGGSLPPLKFHRTEIGAVKVGGSLLVTYVGSKTVEIKEKDGVKSIKVHMVDLIDSEKWDGAPITEKNRACVKQRLSFSELVALDDWTATADPTSGMVVRLTYHGDRDLGSGRNPMRLITVEAL